MANIQLLFNLCAGDKRDVLIAIEKGQMHAKQVVSGDRFRMKRLDALEAVLVQSPVVVFLWQYVPGTWPVELVTENVRRLIGHTADDFMTGRVTWIGVTDPEDVPRLEAEVGEYLAAGAREWEQEYRVITATGARRWIRDWNRPIRDDQGAITHVQGMLADITAQKETQSAFARTHRALRFLTEVNRVLSRAHSEADLLNQVCDISTAIGGYQMAWIGTVGDGRFQTMDPVACTGVGPEAWPPRGCACLAGQQAMRTCRPCICRNLADASLCSNGCRSAKRSGVRSAVSLPLVADGDSLGALCLRSNRPEPFDEDEVEMLMRLADDLAFGIRVLRNREQRLELERELLAISEREQRRIGQDLHDTVGQSIAGIHYLLSAAQQKVGESQSGVKADLLHIAQLLRDAAGQTHELSSALVPDELRSGDLIDALRRLASHTRSIYGLPCRVVTRLNHVSTPDLASAGQVLRIVQEAVNNAARHSGTRGIGIHVTRPKGRLTFSVRDSGGGIVRRGEAEHRGLGHRIMQYRAELIGASLRIESVPGKGTIVTCSLSKGGAAGMRPKEEHFHAECRGGEAETGVDRR